MSSPRCSMKTAGAVSLLVGLATFSLSCSLVGQALSAVGGTGGLSAEATSPVSVQLEWTPVPGATLYRIEAGFEGLDFFAIAEVPGGQPNYTDYVAPGTSTITYRLVAVTEAGESAVGTSAVSMPALSPDPLTVEVQLFEPILPAIPTYDPLNPSASLPPGFDPNNPEAFDPSSLIQPVSTSQEIGPQGGSVSVTAPNQVVYTLEVPVGAVDQLMGFTLTPVRSIAGLPLSGGLVGAVRIQPDGLVFDIPATLTIEPPAVAPKPSAPLTVGFGVSPFSQEFYLHPLGSPAGSSERPDGAGYLASLIARPRAEGTSSSMTIGQGGTFGLGSASIGDVQAQARRVSSDSGEQMAQHNAQQQIANPQAAAASFEKTGGAILQNLAVADTAGRLARATSDLEQYWQDGGSEFNASLNASLIKLYISKVNALFNRAKGDCLTSDDLVASDIADKLQGSKSHFWKAVSAAYHEKYGAAGKSPLDDLVEGKRSCRFTLEITSAVKLEFDTGWIQAEVHTATPIQLRPERHGDPLVATSFRLYGHGSVEYLRYREKSKRCPESEWTQYPQVAITVDGLFPEFGSGGRVEDFWFSSWELGSNFTRMLGVRTTRDRQGCEVKTSIQGGGDLWSGAFVMLHHAEGLREWQSTSQSYPLVFTKKFKSYSIEVVDGGKLTEDATYTITIRRGSK